MEKLTEEEFKEILKLFFNKGRKVGRNQLPLNEIPMGNVMILPLMEFEKFYNETFKK